MTGYSTERLVESWRSALEGNFGILDDICNDDCQIWHSSDNKWMPHRQAMEAFNAARAMGQIPDFSGIQIFPTAKGFLCQTSMTLAPIGRMHIAQLVTVASGAITHVEEYIAPEIDIASRMVAST